MSKENLRAILKRTLAQTYVASLVFLAVVPAASDAKVFSGDDCDCGIPVEISAKAVPFVISGRNSTGKPTVKVNIRSNFVAKGDQIKIDLTIFDGKKKVKKLARTVEAKGSEIQIPIAFLADGENLKSGSYRFTVVAKTVKSSANKSNGLSKLKNEKADGEFIVDGRERALSSNALAVAAAPDESRLVNTAQIAGFPFKLFFGVNHAHTKYSDGGKPLNSALSIETHGATPEDAYKYAREVGKLNFLGITEHNHMMKEKCDHCSDAQVLQRYADCFQTARTQSEPDKFVAVYGMEWGKYKPGHLSIYNEPELFYWQNNPGKVLVNEDDYIGAYNSVAANQPSEKATVCFNHPKSSNFKNFRLPTNSSDVVTGIAILNGPHNSTRTDFSDDAGKVYKAQYEKALGMGWRVAPEAHQDNHFANYGTSTSNRTVVLIPDAEQFTLATYMKALRERRCYASQDRNAHLYFSANNGLNFMGDTFTANSPVSVDVQHFDPSGESLQKIEVFGARVSGSGNTTAQRFLENVGANQLNAALPIQPSGQKWFYYAHLVQNDGDSLWSAPIWIEWQ